MSVRALSVLGAISTGVTEWTVATYDSFSWSAYRSPTRRTSSADCRCSYVCSSVRTAFWTGR